MWKFLIGAVLWSVSCAPVMAATLYMDPPTATLNRGDAVTIALRVDTNEAEGECINAIDGVVTYDASIVPVDVSIGRSIFPVWVENPKIDKEHRTITFAGGIPNGYCRRIEGDPRLTNVVAEIVFRSPGLQIGGGESAGMAAVNFAPETTAYLNDGFGTAATMTTLGTTLTLNSFVGSDIIDGWRDTVAEDTITPEPFDISLEQDNYAFDNKYFIVFNTTDKQTGISHYEVLEESTEEANWFSFGAATAPWAEVRSPYVLKDQTLRSIIRVRAIDKAGNEYVATLAPQGLSMPWYKNATNFLIIGAGGLFVVILIIISVIFWRRRRLKKQATTTITDEINEII